MPRMTCARSATLTLTWNNNIFTKKETKDNYNREVVSNKCTSFHHVRVNTMVLRQARNANSQLESDPELMSQARRRCLRRRSKIMTATSQLENALEKLHHVINAD